MAKIGIFMALPWPKIFMALPWSNLLLAPITLNTYALFNTKTKFLENADKTTTKVMPRSASMPHCSRLKFQLSTDSLNLTKLSKV